MSLVLPALRGIPASAQLGAGLTWEQAFAAPESLLRQWFANNTGPQVPITNFQTGNVTITSQAEADALVGTRVTGTITLSAAVTLHDFEVEAASDNMTGMQQLINMTTAGNGSTVRYFKADGRNGIATFGIGGISTFDACLFEYGEIIRTGQDPIRAGRSNIFQYIYVHQVTGWDEAIQGVPYDFDVHVHTDGVHGQRSGATIQKCWIENGVDDNNTSGVLVSPTEVITSFVVDSNFLDGGGHVMHAHSSGDNLDDPGPTWWPAVTYTNNRIGKNNKNYGTGSSPWAIGSIPSSYLTQSGNVWSETLLPVPAPTFIPEPFTPNLLPGLGFICYGWWDAEWNASLTLSGSAVTEWRDRINGVAFSQATSGNRPAFNATSFNGRAGITFDGVSDCLELDAHTFPTGSADVEIWAIVSQNALAADATSREIFSYGGGSSVTRRLRRQVSSGVNRAGMQIGTGAAGPTVVNSSGGDFSGYHVVHGVWSPTTSTIEMDAGSTNSASHVPATSAGRARIGATDATSAAAFWSGQINSIIITGALDATQKANMYTYFNNRLNGY